MPPSTLLSAIAESQAPLLLSHTAGPPVSSQNWTPSGHTEPASISALHRRSRTRCFGLRTPSSAPESLAVLKVPEPAEPAPLAELPEPATPPTPPTSATSVASPASTGSFASTGSTGPPGIVALNSFTRSSSFGLPDPNWLSKHRCRFAHLTPHRPRLSSTETRRCCRSTLLSDTSVC